MTTAQAFRRVDRARASAVHTFVRWTVDTIISSMEANPTNRKTLYIESAAHASDSKL